MQVRGAGNVDTCLSLSLPSEKLIPKTLASGPLLNPVQCFFAARTPSPFFCQILQCESPHPVPHPWSYLCELSSVWEENAALLARNRLISNLSTSVSLETMIQHSSCLWTHQPTDLTSSGENEMLSSWHKNFKITQAVKCWAAPRLWACFFDRRGIAIRTVGPPGGNLITAKC